MSQQKVRRLFIASSTKALGIAGALKASLENITSESSYRGPPLAVDIWTEANWRQLRSFLDSLIQFSSDYDYGAFILGDDDTLVVEDNKAEIQQPRGNVLFELGLFIGQRGTHAIFPLVPAKSQKFANISDLLGSSMLKYDQTKCRGDFNEAVSATATIARRIIQSISQQEADGAFVHPLTKQIIGLVDSVLGSHIQGLESRIEGLQRTHYLGTHIQFFGDHVCTLLENAVKADDLSDITIASDFPAYAAFSEPKTYSRYRRLVHDIADMALLRDDACIRIKVLAAERREQHDALNTQIEPRLLDKLQAMPRYKQRLESLAKRVGKTTIDNIEDFRAALIKVQNEAALELSQALGDRFAEISTLMPVNMWIVNRKDAVFSMPDLSRPLYEHGFRTKDPSLVGCLAAIWESY